jgi:membrane-associated phospholipid phosphatase
MLESFKQRLAGFDTYLFNFLQAYTNDANTHLMVMLTFLASGNFLLPANVLLVIFFLLVRKDSWSAFRVAVISVSSYLVMATLKLYFHRMRPEHPVHTAASGYSFPSGHAMSSVTFYGLLIYLTWKHITNPLLKFIVSVLLTLLILVIGLSRIYLHVHYASDVLAGYLFGIIWLLFTLWIIQKIQDKTYEMHQ